MQVKENKWYEVDRILESYIEDDDDVVTEINGDDDGGRNNVIDRDIGDLDIDSDNDDYNIQDNIQLENELIFCVQGVGSI